MAWNGLPGTSEAVPPANPSRLVEDSVNSLHRFARELRPAVLDDLGLIAALLGFTSVAGASIAIAKVLFFVFMVIFVVLVVAGLTLARRAG